MLWCTEGLVQNSLLLNCLILWTVIYYYTTTTIILLCPLIHGDALPLPPVLFCSPPSHTQFKHALRRMPLVFSYCNPSACKQYFYHYHIASFYLVLQNPASSYIVKLCNFPVLHLSKLIVRCHFSHLKHHWVNYSRAGIRNKITWNSWRKRQINWTGETKIMRLKVDDKIRRWEEVEHNPQHVHHEEQDIEVSTFPGYHHIF